LRVEDLGTERRRERERESKRGNIIMLARARKHHHA
jgi:hypothetical protein